MKSRQKISYIILASFFFLALLNACAKSVKSYVEEADILVAQNQMDEAIILYQKAIKDHTRDPILYLNQAVLFRNQKKYDLAIKNYQVAHQLNQKSSLPFIGMGRVLFLQNRFAEAKEMYEQALKLSPNQPLGLFVMARVFQELKQGDESLKYYSLALQAKYPPQEIYYYRGKTYEEVMGNRELAMQDYETYLKLKGPKYEEVLLRLTQLRQPVLETIVHP